MPGHPVQAAGMVTLRPKGGLPLRAGAPLSQIVSPMIRYCE